MKYTHALIATASFIGFTSLATAEQKPSCEKSGKCTTECDITSCDSEGGTEFVVTGMTCGGCSKKLNSVVTALDGVSVKKVCHKSKSLVVAIDESKSSKEAVCAAVTGAGFAVTGEKVSVSVSGMTCGNCSGKLSKALEAVAGVTVQKVCHKSGHVDVVISGKASRKQVEETIVKTGYKVGTTAAAAAKVQ